MLKLCSIIVLLFLISCGEGHFPKFEEKPMPPMEEIAGDFLTRYLKSSSQCPDQKVALVTENMPLLKTVLRQIIDIALSNTTEMTKVPLKEFLLAVVENNFEIALTQTSEIIHGLTENKVFLDNFEKALKSLPRSGWRVAEILKGVSKSEEQQHTLSGAVKLALCEDKATGENIWWAMQIESLKPHAGHALNLLLIETNLFDSSLAINEIVHEIEYPEELNNFIVKVKEKLPKLDWTEKVCSLQVKNYQKHFNLVATLLETPADESKPRPIHVLINMLSKLSTLKNSNHCEGTGFDDLTREDIISALLTIAEFIKDKDLGLIGILEIAKPRT